MDDGMDWLIPRPTSPKRKSSEHDRTNGRKVARGIHQLRNWHLGIPGSEEPEDDDPYGDSVGSPAWAASHAHRFDEESEEEDVYGGRFEPIGLAPNDLHFTVADFPHGSPLRQDGTDTLDERDQKFYGNEWREEYLTKLDALHKDKDYIWLQLLAGATNTTVENLLSIKDLETRALRSRVVLEKQSADIKTRFVEINNIREEVVRARKVLDDEQKKLEGTSLARAEAERASDNKKQLKLSKESFEREDIAQKRLQDYVLINTEFTKWVSYEGVTAEQADLTKDTVIEAMNRRLESIGIDTSLNGAPGLRGLPAIEHDAVRNQARDLYNNKNDLGRDRTGDLIFLGMWILYEMMSVALANIRLPGHGAEQTVIENIETNVKGVLVKTKGVLEKQADGHWINQTRLVEFGRELSGKDQTLLKAYFKNKFRDLLYAKTESPANLVMDNILAGELVKTDTKVIGLFNSMIEDAVDTMRFMNFIPHGTKFGSSGRPGRRYDISNFQADSEENKLKGVKKILEDLRVIIVASSVDTESIKETINEKKEELVEFRRSLDRLLKTPVGSSEPDLPYRPEGEWVLDPINTGRIQPVPIVLKGISEAYQKIVRFVPSLAPGNPRNSDQRKTNLKVLQHDLRYQDDFLNLVARFMGISRQAFNVRWMPDLLGNHKQVITESIRNLRSVGSRGIDASFARTFAGM